MAGFWKDVSGTLFRTDPIFHAPKVRAKWKTFDAWWSDIGYLTTSIDDKDVALDAWNAARSKK